MSAAVPAAEAGYGDHVLIADADHRVVAQCTVYEQSRTYSRRASAVRTTRHRVARDVTQRHRQRSRLERVSACRCSFRRGNA